MVGGLTRDKGGMGEEGVMTREKGEKMMRGWRWKGVEDEGCGGGRGR